MQLNKNILFSLLTILFCFLLDRLSKIYVIKFLIENNLKDYYINNFFNLTLIWNKGTAFGFFQSEALLYHFISFLIFIIIIYIFYLIFISKFLFERFFYSIILGGALGNFFDRIYYNAVPDFIDLHYKNYHWFTFNVSDILITIGIILLLMREINFFKLKNND